MIENFYIWMFLPVILIYISYLIVLILPRKEKSYNFFPNVSIIIPAHNEEKYIEKTIKSILENDYPAKKEIIVVNDGSTDKTEKIVKKFKEVKLINIKHSGKAKAINIGIKNAKFEHLVILDADSFLEKNLLKKLLAPLKEKNIGASTCFIRANLNLNPLTWFQDLEYVLSSAWKFICSKISSSSVLAGIIATKKALIEKIGYFQNDTLTEDLDVGIRIKKAGYKNVIVPSVIYTNVPQTLKSFIKQRIRWARGTIQNIKKHKDLFFSKENLSFSYYVILTQIFWYFFSIFYIPLTFYKLIGDFVIYFVQKNLIFSIYSAKYLISWLSAFGIFEALIKGNLTLPLISAILTYFFAILVLIKFFKPNIKHFFSLFFIFPYSVLNLFIQGFCLIRESLSKKKVKNIWDK